MVKLSVLIIVYTRAYYSTDSTKLQTAPGDEKLKRCGHF